MRLGTKPTVLEGNYFFLFLSMLLLFVGGFFQSREIYSGLLISQYILILTPVLLFLKIKKYSIKENLRLNKTSFKNIILSLIITIFTYPIAMFFNLITITIVEKFGFLMESPIPNPETGLQLLISFLIISVTPGICEEIAFRGLLMSSFEKLGKRKAIIYSAVLFGVFHYNFQNLLGPIVLGIIYGIMVYKTNSIVVSMIAHGANNSIAIVLGYILSKVEFVNETMVMEEQVANGEPSFLIAFIVLGIFAFLCGVVVSRLIKQLDEGENNSKKNIIEISKDNIIWIKEVEKINFVTVLPIIIISIIYLAINYLQFFTTYASTLV